MRSYGWVVLVPTMVMLLLTVFPPEGNAIPAFARRHKVSCTTCHAPFPTLKPFGDEFAGSGFVMPDDDPDRDYIIEGDELLRLNRDFPISARFDAYAMFEESADVDNDLQTPWGLKLMSGGVLYRNIGYYFYFYMSERGEVVGIEDAYVHFNDIMGQPFDVMVGQFQTSDPLMKRELRLTFEDYQIYKVRPGGSGTNLAYDRGLMLVYGLEETGTDLVGMIVNGNGSAEAGADRKFDSDRFKNVGFRISQAIGEHLSVGGFFYRGEEAPDVGWKNEMTYYGPDVNAAAGPLELTAQYLTRTDSAPPELYTPGGKEPDEDIETAGLVAELILRPQLDESTWLLTLLYNQVDYDQAAVAAQDYETMTVSATHLLARNLRFIVEYTRDLEGETSRGVLGFVAGI